MTTVCPPVVRTLRLATLLFLAMAGLAVLAGAGCGKGMEDTSAHACDSTLPGCDADADGVRDDVQKLIDEKSFTKPAERVALLQLARAMRRVLQATTSTHADLQRDYDRAVVCETYTSGYDKSMTDSHWLESKMFDTPARLHTYLQFEEQSGSPSGVDDEDAKNCEIAH